MNRLGLIVFGGIVLLAAVFAMLLTNGSGTAAVVEPVKREVVAAIRTGMVIPVLGVRREQLADSWHDARGGGERLHEGLDIMAPGGTPVVAAIAGTVEKLHLSEAGGITASIRSLDGKWIAYYAHMQSYTRGLREGQRLAKGAPIGFVGDTGNSGAGNTHLHFAVNRMAPGERWHQGTPVNPYPLLAAKRDAR